MSNSQVQNRQNFQNKHNQIEDMFTMMQEKFQNTFKQQPNTQHFKNLNLQVVIQNRRQGQAQNKPISDRKRRSVKKLAKQNIKLEKQQNHLNTADSISQRQNNLDQQVSNNSNQNQNNNNQCLSNNSSPYKKINSHFKQNNKTTDANQSAGSQSPNNKASNNKQKSYLVDSNVKSTSILDYKDLQQKIQSALKKNYKFQKQFSSPSSLIKSNLTSRSFSQFNQCLLNRFQEYQKKKERQIQRRKQEIQQRQQKQLKFHPKINKKSQKFVEQMGGHQPIESRYQKILQAKNKKIQQHEQKKRIKQQQQYQEFKQQFEKYKKSPQASTRSYDQFYEEMLKWKLKAQKNVEEKKKFIEQRQMKETNQFKPKINKKSEAILMSSAKIQKRVPIHERQIPSQKRYKTKFDEQCTFKPKINKRKVK